MLGDDGSAPWMCFGRGSGGGAGGGSPPQAPEKLSSLPISSVTDVYDVFKMDVISLSLSAYVTPREYSEIRAQMLADCGVDACAAPETLRRGQGGG